MSYLVITLIVYYTLVLFVGVWRFRHQKPKEYVTAPDSTGFLSLTMSLLGTIVGGGMFLGVTQIGFEKGITALALAISYLAGSIMLGILAPHLRDYAKDKNVNTLFGVFEKLYPSKDGINLTAVFSWVTFFVFFLMLAVQFTGIATFLSFYMRINFHVTIMVGAAIIAGLSIPIYTALGGFRRDIYTDIIQVIFVSLGLIIILYRMVGSDITSKLSNLPKESVTPGGTSIIFFIGVLFFVAPTFLLRFDLWQRMITAKSGKHARAAFITSGFLSFLFFVAFGVIGMYAKGNGITDAKFSGLEAIQKIVKEPFLGIVVASFFAAVMSSADTFLGVSGLALARGTVYRKGELEQLDEDKVSVRKLRFFAFFVGLAGVALAYIFKNIVDLFASAFGILIIFLPSFIGGLIRKTSSSKESWWSICIGLVVFLPLVFLIPKEAFLPAFLASLITYLLLMYKHRKVNTDNSSIL